MDRRKITVFVAVLVIGAVVFGLTRGKDQGINPSKQLNPAAVNKNLQKANPNNESASVSITNFTFGPPQITVKKGGSISWTNNDSVPHTVVETDKQTGPSSGNLSNGAKYTYTYQNPGIYRYHCSIHPNMIGVVKVVD